MKVRFHRALCLAGVSAAAFTFGAGGVWAQESASQTGQSETIVVTARRVQESLVVTGAGLEDTLISSIRGRT